MSLARECLSPGIRSPRPPTLTEDKVPDPRVRIFTGSITTALGNAPRVCQRRPFSVKDRVDHRIESGDYSFEVLCCDRNRSRDLLNKGLLPEASVELDNRVSTKSSSTGRCHFSGGEPETLMRMVTAFPGGIAKRLPQCRVVRTLAFAGRQFLQGKTSMHTHGIGKRFLKESTFLSRLKRHFDFMISKQVTLQERPPNRFEFRITLLSVPFQDTSLQLACSGKCSVLDLLQFVFGQLGEFSIQPDF